MHELGRMLCNALQSPYLRAIWVAVLLILAYALAMRAA
jgi:hypothetical protein